MLGFPNLAGETGGFSFTAGAATDCRPAGQFRAAGVLRGNWDSRWHSDDYIFFSDIAEGDFGVHRWLGRARPAPLTPAFGWIPASRNHPE